jgi:hypothetical protein
MTEYTSNSIAHNFNSSQSSLTSNKAQHSGPSVATASNSVPPPANTNQGKSTLDHSAVAAAGVVPYNEEYIHKVWLFYKALKKIKS